eukprot:2197423-Amphidinium_carterae.5
MSVSCLRELQAFIRFCTYKASTDANSPVRRLPTRLAKQVFDALDNVAIPLGKRTNVWDPDLPSVNLGAYTTRGCGVYH